MAQKSLIYLPVERYKSRWTEYVSGDNGMFAQSVKDYGRVELIIISPHNELLSVSSGSVVDVQQRTNFGFLQVSKLVSMILSGQVTSESIIYVEDFWLPGMEMIPYACEIKGVYPKIYAFCHAQSVDPYDFTYKMSWWMRDIERGWFKFLAGVFVADSSLKYMLHSCGFDTSKVHVTGTVFKRSVLLQYLNGGAYRRQRTKTIAFTSRLDEEKDPNLFLEIKQRYHTYIDPAVFRFGTPKWRFIVISGKRIPAVWRNKFWDYHITCYDDVPKDQYFRLLTECSILVNTSKQDFVGYNQLDAMAVGCIPVCPNRLGFPTLFDGDRTYLYDPGDALHALNKISAIIDKGIPPNFSDEAPEIYKKFGMKYEGSVARMLDIMLATGNPFEIENEVENKSGDEYAAPV